MREVLNIPLVLILLSMPFISRAYHVSHGEKLIFDNYGLEFSHGGSQASNQFASPGLVLDSVGKEEAFYRNGKTRYIVWSFYDELKHERKKLVLRFRKNGNKRSVRQYEVTPDGDIRIIYHIQYDPNGDLAAENYYAYDSYGILIQNEPEGSSQ